MLKSTCYTRKNSPHEMKHIVLHNPKISSAWKACGSCHLFTFQGFGSWWPFRGKYQGHWVWALSLSPGTAHMMLPQTAFMQSPWLVVLVQTLGNHLRTMRTLGKDKSCLFFHNFSRPKHSLKATRIHEFFHTINGLQRGFVTIRCLLPWGFSALQTSEALPTPLSPTSHEIHVWSGSTVLRGMGSGAAPAGSLVGTCPLQNT